jgi:hypothetical protein
MAALKPRSVPRRIVHGLQVNHEFDLFQARLHILGTKGDFAFFTSNRRRRCALNSLYQEIFQLGRKNQLPVSGIVQDQFGIRMTRRIQSLIQNAFRV